MKHSRTEIAFYSQLGIFASTPCMFMCCNYYNIRLKTVICHALHIIVILTITINYNYMFRLSRSDIYLAKMLYIFGDMRHAIVLLNFHGQIAINIYYIIFGQEIFFQKRPSACSHSQWTIALVVHLHTQLFHRWCVSVKVLIAGSCLSLISTFHRTY